MSTPGVFVPGLFSQAGRSTAFEIENLQNQLHLHSDEKSTAQGPGDAEGGERPKPKVHSKGAGAAKSPEELKPRTPGGELAKAIQEKLRSKTDKVAKQKIDPNTAQNQLEEKIQPSYPFSNEGKEGNYASKFTASYDIGAINHRQEQRPDPAWYQVKHESVLHRPPEWDFRARQKHRPRSKPEGDHAADSMSFMTGLDLDDKDAMSALTSRQRSLLKESMGNSVEKPKTVGSMSLNSERGPLGKIGRHHVMANEVSCAGDSDVLDQDIKGYQKLRYPRWDFDAPAARQPLIPADAMGEPGKYDVNIDCVKGVPKSGIGFGKALPRTACVSTMGYSAPPAILHPEEKRTRGSLPDRSNAKDGVRNRITHVNDFDRELARPPLLTGAAQNFHNENDPAACDTVLQRELSYDATTADHYVTHRRDIAPKYAKMLGRGRDSVQGLRALSSDLAVRGSVGLGFVETTSMVESTVEQRESRAADGTKENPNRGPRLCHRTVFVHNQSTDMTTRGKPLVRGTGLDTKQAPLWKKDHPILTNAFKRSPSLPGFDARSKFGGTRVLTKSRSSVAIPGWAPTELDGEAA